MPVTAELRARTGEKYTAHDGQERERYITVGVQIESNGRRFLKFDGLPVRFDGFVYFSEPRERAKGAETPPGLARPVDDSDIPF
ncbi:MAG TPA: hypothetical protein PKV98_16340 [Burkholderiaceae bacterium]|nr:hypothetical protein [Burkholderiaceae bacterium]